MVIRCFRISIKSQEPGVKLCTGGVNRPMSKKKKGDWEHQGFLHCRASSG